ncbi:Clp protease ClpC [Pandoraea terrae]|uniref:Clp protease ClpC n=1 Tax=Pandoraea terrae TaxID=1537710 RepID=A0A5E4ZBQ4_9BURK|nr:hypothetical protein [Pandoraea terrae]VVE58278.1 Clp protease ClpC [Pandoraea terrae]
MKVYPRGAAPEAELNITLKFDDTLTDHLVEAGYRLEFGARELKRQLYSLRDVRTARFAVMPTAYIGNVCQPWAAKRHHP